jgi:acetolactate synthase-1/2/3 large subunit
MWAAQFYGFEEPNRWMTSGGLGTMGYGLPAALGVQIAHPDALVIDIAGDASVQMTMQEMSDGGAVRPADQDLHPQQPVYGHGAPVAAAAARQPPVAFLHRGDAGFRQAGRGLWRPRHPLRQAGELDDAIKEMIDVKKPVLFDCRVANLANCFPMIPSGKAHNEMLLPDEATDEAVANAIDAKGKALV